MCLEFITYEIIYIYPNLEIQFFSLWCVRVKMLISISLIFNSYKVQELDVSTIEINSIVSTRQQLNTIRTKSLASLILVAGKLHNDKPTKTGKKLTPACKLKVISFKYTTIRQLLAQLASFWGGEQWLSSVDLKSYLISSPIGVREGFKVEKV